MHRWCCSLFCLGLLGASHAATLDAAGESQRAAHVLNRLGYGPRPGDLARVSAMGIDRYIDAQLDPATLPLPENLTRALDALTTTHPGAGRELAAFLAARAAARDDDVGAKRERREVIARITRETAQARLVRAIDSPRQLEEVMTDFWFNHFNVFAGKGLDRALIGDYERDAIRPYALGHFRDLLGATAKAPAMLFYLDNWTSSAATQATPQPTSPTVNNVLDSVPVAGARKPKARATGINENYARELMELHTLGVDGGYSQHDVTELARMLTGWSFVPRALAETGRGFVFDARRHDNGDKQWRGHVIHPQGQQEGEQALDILAAHPATARHLSFQLAQYFVRDEPPPALVERMAQRYLNSGGDIRAVLHLLFHSPEFMAPETIGAKFKTPYQFVVSAARASGYSVTNVAPLSAALQQLGMPLFGCPTPDGYKNTRVAWLNPDALTRRIAFVTTLASGRLPLTGMPEPASAGIDARVLRTTLGSVITPRTMAVTNDNPPAMQAALLLGSPDFMQH